MDGTVAGLFFAISLMSVLHLATCQQGNLDQNTLDQIFGQGIAQPGVNQPQIPSEDVFGPTTTTASPQYLNCFNSCQTINNYNPVCGSDGVTYPNKFKLDCANRCGHGVTMVRGGICAR